MYHISWVGSRILSIVDWLMVGNLCNFWKNNPSLWCRRLPWSAHEKNFCRIALNFEMTRQLSKKVSNAKNPRWSQTRLPSNSIVLAKGLQSASLFKGNEKESHHHQKVRSQMSGPKANTGPYFWKMPVIWGQQRWGNSGASLAGIQAKSQSGTGIQTRLVECRTGQSRLGPLCLRLIAERFWGLSQSTLGQTKEFPKPVDHLKFRSCSNLKFELQDLFCGQVRT